MVTFFMRELLFYSDYPKLDGIHFTTIRQHGTGLKVGSLCRVKSPHKQFNARVLGRSKLPLEMIPDKILLMDTDTTSREDAYKILRGCWDKQVNDETWVVLLRLARIGSSRVNYINSQI